MRSSLALGSVALLAGLTACGLLGPTYTSSVTDTYDPAEYARVVGTKTVPVTVIGSAAGISGAPLTQAIVNAMTGHDWSPHARFTTAPNPDTDGYFSIIVLLNGPANATGAGLCSGQALRNVGTAAAGDVRLIAGLCRYGVAVSETSGQTSGVSSAQDPKFAQLAAGAIRELVPAISTYRTGSDQSDSGGP
jgi:hypothetical protein